MTELSIVPVPCALIRRFWWFASMLALVGLSVPTALSAQQFGVDDATLASFPACQLEAWRDETETRIEPACHLVPNLEVTLGLGFDPDFRDRIQEYTLEFKTAFRQLEPGGFGISLVAALDYDPRPDDDDGEVSSVLAYLPATLSVGDDRLLLHANLGWRYRTGGNNGNGDGDASGREHSPLLGVRGDLTLPWLDERLVVVGELFSDDGERPEYQVGFRTQVVPDRLIVDVSWGGHTAHGGRGKGWIFGFGWTPPRLQ